MEQKNNKNVLKIVVIIIAVVALFIIFMVGCGYYFYKSIMSNKVLLPKNVAIEEIIADDSIPDGEFTELVYTEFTDGEEYIITVTDSDLIKEVYDLIVGTRVEKDGVDVNMYVAKYIRFEFENENGKYKFVFIPYSYYEHLGEHEMNSANADRIKKASEMIVNSGN